MRSLSTFLRTWFWGGLIRFAYRRLREVSPVMPIGIPTIRDPDNICRGYAPRQREAWDFECWGDRHSLCRRCAHYVPNETHDGKEDALLEEGEQGGRI